MTHKPELLHVIEQNERDKDARCVRLVDSNGVFALVIDEKYGERFAALWNMAERLGLSTEEIEGIASDTNSEATVECFLGCTKSNDLMKKYMRKHYKRTR